METESALIKTTSAEVPTEAPLHCEPTRPRILVVDDNADNLTILRLFFESQNFEVMAAEDGVTAWTLIQECRPDLILTDYQMPGMSGLDLSRLVRSTAQTCHIPILVHSAHDCPSVAETSLYDDWFDKPADLNSLSETIRSWVAARARSASE